MLKKNLLLLAFCEGAAVMIAEIAGAKMLAPYYGTSLYVWASTLAITLGALTIGYYCGGLLSERKANERSKVLLYILLIAGLLLAAMPFLAKFIMSFTIHMHFMIGVLISQSIYLFPCILCLGMSGPLIIGIIGAEKDSGRAAGLAYAISTLGGVLATLLCGFYLIPQFGLQIPCLIISSVLMLMTLLVLGKQKKVALFLFPLLPIALLFGLSSFKPSHSKYQIVHHSEGMLGQVKIMDMQYTTQGKIKETLNTRVMLVNHIWQTWVTVDSNQMSLIYYTRFAEALINRLNNKNKVLIVGLGGGTIAQILEKKGIPYDVVEIDGRLPALAKTYFGLENIESKTIIDDGRHFINQCTTKYDMVIIDALLGDTIPEHLLTKECFEKLKTCLTPQGKLFIEFDGIAEGNDGKAQQLLYNTINAVDMTCKIYSSFPNSSNFDFMYVASVDGDTAYYDQPIPNDFYYPIEGNFRRFDITYALPHNTSAILTDDHPVLDYHLRTRAIEFRTKFFDDFNFDFMAEGIPFYK